MHQGSIHRCRKPSIEKFYPSLATDFCMQEQAGIDVDTLCQESHMLILPCKVEYKNALVHMIETSENAYWQPTF